MVFHNRLGEIAAQYLRKGSKIYVEGSLRTRKWQDKEGRDRYTTEIHANEMQRLDSKSGGGGGGSGGGGEGSYGGGAAARSGPAPGRTSEPATEGAFHDDPIDDIPF